MLRAASVRRRSPSCIACSATRQVADLDSEQLDALELGIKAQYATLAARLAAFDMDKTDVILRDSNGFNVSDGRTSHQGIEYELDLAGRSTGCSSARPAPSRGIATSSRARSTAARRSPSGNDVDTAPRELLRAALRLAIRCDGCRPKPSGWWSATTCSMPRTRIATAATSCSNLRARWRVRAAAGRLRARLNNALDRAYADRADFAFGTYRYFPGRGRAVFVELAWQH